MSRVTRAMTLVALAAASLAARQGGQGAQGATMRTTSDAVFTAEQATRGRALYGEHCAMCHGPTLGGIEMAPPLAGPEFYATWSGVPIDDLFERIVLTMPQAKPGSLSRRQNADIVAFMLSVNKAPAGQVELPPDAEALKLIRLVPTN